MKKGGQLKGASSVAKIVKSLTLRSREQLENNLKQKDPPDKSSLLGWLMAPPQAPPCQCSHLGHWHGSYFGGPGRTLLELGFRVDT